MKKFYGVCAGEIVCVLCIAMISVISKTYELLFLAGGLIPMVIFTCGGYYKKVKNAAVSNKAGETEDEPRPLGGEKNGN